MKYRRKIDINIWQILNKIHIFFLKQEKKDEERREREPPPPPPPPPPKKKGGGGGGGKGERLKKHETGSVFSDKIAAW